jgi:hypothetical protein
LYYHVQPTVGASINVGLYKDEQCSQVYTGKDITIDDVLGPILASSSSSSTSSSISQELKQWNSALQAFSFCQPRHVIWLVYYIRILRSMPMAIDTGRPTMMMKMPRIMIKMSLSVKMLLQNMAMTKSINAMSSDKRHGCCILSQGTVNGIHLGNQMLGEPYRKKHLGLSLVLFLLSALLLAYGEF